MHHQGETGNTHELNIFWKCFPHFHFPFCLDFWLRSIYLFIGRGYCWTTPWMAYMVDLYMLLPIQTRWSAIHIATLKLGRELQGVTGNKQTFTVSKCCSIISMCGISNDSIQIDQLHTIWWGMVAGVFVAVNTKFVAKTVFLK